MTNRRGTFPAAAALETRLALILPTEDHAETGRRTPDLYKRINLQTSAAPRQSLRRCELISVGKLMAYEDRSNREGARQGAEVQLTEAGLSMASK
jgi:hypothetical protein